MIHPNMQPAQMPVMSNFVPIPFEAMAKAGAAAQQRYDQMSGIGDQIDEGLGEAKGLERVASFIGSVGSREVNDKKMVDAEVVRLRGRLDNVIKNNPNLLGTEYKTAINSLLRDVKKSYSSEGVIGKAKANINAYQEIMDMRAKNTDWQDDSSVAYRPEMALKNFADTPEGQIGTLSSVDGMAKYTDIGDEVESAIKSAEDRLISEGYTNYLTPEGYKQLVTTKGKDKEYITNLVKEELYNNPKAWKTILRRAGMSGLAGGDATQEGLVDAEVDRAVRKFFKMDTKRKFFKNDKVSDSDKYNGEPWARDVTMGVSGLETTYGVEDFGDVIGKVSGASRRHKEMNEKLTSYLKTNDITLENPVDKGNTDHSSVIFDYQRVIKSLKAEEDKWKQIDTKLRKESGLGMDDMDELIDEFGSIIRSKSFTDEEKKKINDAEREVVRKFIAGDSDNAIRNWIAEAVSSMTFNRTTKDELGAHFAQMFNWMSPKVRHKVENYEALLESEFGDYSTTMGVTSLDKLSKNSAFDLTSFAGDWQNSAEILTTTGENKALDKDGMEDLVIKDNTLQGRVTDPVDGSTKLVYNVLNTDGGYTRIKVAPPKNFDLYLVQSGQEDMYEMQIQSQLYSETDRLKKVTKGTNTITLGEALGEKEKAKYEEAGYTVPSKSPVSNFELTTRVLPASGRTQWVVSMVTSDGKPVDYPLDSQADAVQVMSKFHKDNLNEYLKAILKSKKETKTN